MHWLGRRQVSWASVTPCTKATQTRCRRTPRTPEQKAAETRALAYHVRLLLEKEPRTKVQLIALTKAYQTDVEMALEHLRAVKIAPTSKNRPRYALPN